MAHLLAETCGSADVVIHNEELLPLAEEWLEWGRGRVLYFSHGLSSQEHPDTPALVELQHELARLPVPVCAPSPAQAQIARHVLGRPVEPLRLPLALLPQREPRLGAIRRGVIAAGRFVPQKGFDLLIRALGKLDERPRCTIVGGHGDTQYERECRMLASECEVEVSWRDWTTHEELTEMLVLSALLAVPSRFEPLGLIAAEAIAVHTPVVGFRVGGLANLLDAAGQPAVELTDEESAVDGLAETIRWMVNDPPQVSGSALQHWDAQAMVTDLERSFAGGGPQW
ncbi:glycosyltransferase family 4 protein [Microbacterium paulum]